MADLIAAEDMKVEGIYLKTGTTEPRRGGQHVGIDLMAVRVTHIPTGVMAQVQANRSQHVARMIAVGMVEAALTHPMFRAP